MGFWSYFITELDERHSFWLTGVIVACWFLRPFLPEKERKSVGLLSVLWLLHMLLAAAAVLREASDPSGSAKYFRLASYIFSSFVFVSSFNLFFLGAFLARLRVTVPMVLRELFTFALVLTMVLVASPSLGFDWRGVAVTATGLVAVVGLALQKPMGNWMGRITLQMDRSITIGDWISLDGIYGQVTDIRWRYAQIETNNFETLVIPNGVLMESKFTVLGRRNRMRSPWRRWVFFNVDYRTPPGDLIQVVNEMLQNENLAHVVREPQAHTLMMGLENSVGRYAVRYWLDDPHFDDATDSLIRTRIYYALKRLGVEVAMPVQSVFVTEQDEARALTEAEHDLRMRSRALSHVGLFQSLKENERHALARSMRRAPFAEGEFIARQGEQATWLYILERGTVSVRVSVDGAEAREVATLKDGDYFGEMGLMTGEPRTASVVATSNVESFRLDKDAFKEMLQNRPAIADYLAEDLAKRRIELEAVREHLDKETQAKRMVATKNHLLDKIKKYFAIS